MPRPYTFIEDIEKMRDFLKLNKWEFLKSYSYLLEEEYIDNSDKILKWSNEDLSSQNLTSIDGDKYIVYYDLENPNNCEIYYLQGYEGKHSLSELKNAN